MNMVPFIDVMLVLLIIFMVSAPLITVGVVDLPSVGKAAQRPNSVVEVIVGLDEKLKLRLDGGDPQPTTLGRLGSYRLRLDAAGGTPAFTLSTLDGALQLDGSGQWSGSQLRFRGQARAAPGAEGELDNLLNFFGRRQGALSLISIG